MKKLIEEIKVKIAETQKEKVTAFRDVAIGGLMSAVHGLEVAEENLAWHKKKIEEKESAKAK